MSDTIVVTEQGDVTVVEVQTPGPQGIPGDAGSAAVTSVNTRTGAVTGLAEQSSLTAHTSATNNPHAVTKAQVGLANVPNLDTTTAVSQTHTHANQAVLDNTTVSFTTALATKLGGIATGATANQTDTYLLSRTNHTGTQTSSTISDFAAAAGTAAPVQSVAGRTGAVVLAKADVSLGNVDNTADASKPISTATQTALNGKEPTITAGTAGQYFRGDKTWQTLDKTAAGLGNVTNNAQYYPGGTTVALADGGTGSSTASGARSNLGLGTIATQAAPSGTVVGTSDTQTLTNKRITKRTGTATSSAAPTINTDNVDFFSLTAQAVDITSFTTNLSGTPTEGQTLWLAITGTAARAITWGASFETSTAALPTTTVSTNRLDVGLIWNSATSKWRCVAVA